MVSILYASATLRSPSNRDASKKDDVYVIEFFFSSYSASFIMVEASCLFPILSVYPFPFKDLDPDCEFEWRATLYVSVQFKEP